MILASGVGLHDRRPTRALVPTDDRTFATTLGLEQLLAEVLLEVVDACLVSVDHDVDKVAARREQPLAASQLESDVNTLEGLDSEASFEDVTDSVSSVVADIGDLESAASSDSDLSSAVDDVSSAVDELENAVKDLPNSSSAEDALNSLSAPLDDVNSSLDELQSAASCN